MDPSQYGPFANSVAIATALVATFAMLVVKAIGRVRRWTWLAGDTAPPLLVTAGPRLVAVAVMAVAYVTIDTDNYLTFAGGAFVVAVLGFVAVARFDHLRRVHLCEVPRVAGDGGPLLDKRGRQQVDKVVVGLESEMRSEAQVALSNVRSAKGGLSLCQFILGYGAQKLGDPAAAWDQEILAKHGSKLGRLLMYIVLSGALTLFLSALVIEVAGRT